MVPPAFPERREPPECQDPKATKEFPEKPAPPEPPDSRDRWDPKD